MCDVCDDRLLYIVDVRSLILQVLKKAADFQEHCCRLAAQELCEEYARNFFSERRLAKMATVRWVRMAYVSPLLQAASTKKGINSSRLQYQAVSKSAPAPWLLAQSTARLDCTVHSPRHGHGLEGLFGSTLGKLPGPGSVSRRPILLACG